MATYTYRSTLVNAETGKLKNLTTEISTEGWFEYMRGDPMGLYGNSVEAVEKNVLPALESGDTALLAAGVTYMDNAWHEQNRSAIFQLAMFVWDGFKAGKYSAEAWATTLAICWQSGSRGMLAGVKLSQATALEMFRAAPIEKIMDVACWEGEDLTKEYAEMPDEVQVFRGYSTGIEHYETGMSWTRDPQEAFNFMSINTHNEGEIPGLASALIPKHAILGLFSYEKEVVVDPTVPKIALEKSFLKGSELREFRKKWKEAHKNKK